MTAQNDIRKFLPTRIRTGVGKNLAGFIQTVNESNERLEQLVQACIDQLFLQTAGGRFLVQLGEQEGFVMPANSGLDIRSYKSLVPIMVSNPKQVRLTLQELIEAFYGRDRTRPSVLSGSPGPFSLKAGDDLIVETESGLLTISVTADQVSDLSNVSPAEIAAVFNTTQTILFADQVTDRATNLEYLRLSSNSSGASAFVRIAGGKLQNFLRFPKVIATQNATGTNWLLTKSSPLSDTLRFTWDGAGTNPNVYLSKAGDVITIRDFVDGAEAYSLLNGSYTAVDVGYDYFIVRNDRFDALSSNIAQTSDDNIVFTKNQNISIYNNEEYALTSETSQNTVTLTVPAIPPLARRFLAGSAHLQGSSSEVLDFTRTSLKIQVATGSEKPTGLNHFLLSNAFFRLDFRHLYYNTIAVDNSATTPAYMLETNDEDYSVFPYTTAAGIGANPFYGNVDSPDIEVGFPFRHGFNQSWGITFGGAIGATNILTGDLNAEHQVARVINEDTLVIRVKDGSGNYKKFQGFAFGPCDVYQHAIPQGNNSDFYLEFVSAAAAIASGIEIGSRFKLDQLGGTEINAFIGQMLKFRFLVAVERTANRIHFTAGWGVGPNGLIIDNATGRRSGFFGGSSVTQYLNKASVTNQLRVFNDLKATFLGYTPSSNPEFVGSFLYDPTGERTTVTVSRYVVRLNDGVLRGDNVPALLIDTTSVDDEEFPQSGELVMDYGKDSFEGPIRYYAVISNPGSNQILIDPAYRFKKTHPIGATVQRISADSPFKPDLDGTDLPVYITGTASARNTLFALAELLVAAGVFIEQDVNLPDLRYEDTSIQVFD